MFESSRQYCKGKESAEDSTAAEEGQEEEEEQEEQEEQQEREHRQERRGSTWKVSPENSVLTLNTQSPAPAAARPSFC